MLTQTKGKLVLIPNKSFYFVFNLVLKISTKKCTIFLFSYYMSYILSVSQSDFMGIVSPNLIVLRSFNYQNLI